MTTDDGGRGDVVRVAIHADQLWFSAPGGIGTYVAELLAALPGLGADVVPFWVAERTGAPADRVAPEPVEIPGSIRRLYPSWALGGRPPLPAAFADRDAIHATNHAAVPPARRGQALVVTVHDLAFDVVPETFPRQWRWLYRAGVRAAARRADLILTPSHATADDLQSRYGVEAARLAVTPLAGSLPRGDVDVDRVLDRLGVPRPYVLCAGTLEPRKNQAVLLRAWRQVTTEVPHALVLAGPDGWGVAPIEAELARGGLDTVVRTGRLHGVDLDAVLRGADLVAYPSRYEGFGLPIVEAMQRGVPVVTTTTPACAETAGGAAALVDPDDVGGLADAIAGVLTDRVRHEALAAAGLERAARFSWEATARATLEAYRVAIDRARSSS